MNSDIKVQDPRRLPGFSDRLVIELIRDGHSAWLAEKLTTEFAKFIGVVASHPNEQFGMAGPVDDVWHKAVLDTRAYQVFCRAVAGRFIHHIPGYGSKADTRRYENTLEKLALLYGRVDEEIWPSSPATIASCAGCSSDTKLPAQGQASSQSCGVSLC